MSKASMASKGQGSADKGPKSGKPPGMRPRDFARMSNLNDKKSQSTGSWFDQSEVEEKHNAAAETQGRRKKYGKQEPKNKQERSQTAATVKSQQKDFRRARWEPSAESRLSTTETPPRDEPMCEGVFKGSKIITNTASQNLDFSMFPILIRATYEEMVKVDNILLRICPFPIYQHYCFVLLNAYIMDYQRAVNKHPDTRNFVDALKEIAAETLHIPAVIHDYIQSACNALNPSGEKITWNYPSSAIPQDTVVLDESIISSGSFGQPTAENHNVYECYCSPYISRTYIELSCELQHDAPQAWPPFPEEWNPNGYLATPNLLGYWPIEKHHREAQQRMESCVFTEGDTLRGRLAYSPEVMAAADNAMSRMAEKFSIVLAKFRKVENASIFIVKYFSRRTLHSGLSLCREYANLFSPYSFGSENANKVQYHGLKRKRDRNSAGVMYVTQNGEEMPDVWQINRDNNYEMLEPFQPVGNSVDHAMLRHQVHESTGLEGPLLSDVHAWLSEVMPK